MGTLVAYPTTYEVCIDGDDDVYAKFIMFDNESFEIKIDNIMSSYELREIADLLDKVLKVSRDGIE